MFAVWNWMIHYNFGRALDHWVFQTQISKQKTTIGWWKSKSHRQFCRKPLPVGLKNRSRNGTEKMTAKPGNFHGTKSEAGKTTEPFPYQCQGDKRVAQYKGPCCFLIELGRSRCRRVAGPAGFFYENILLEPAVMTSYVPRFFKFSPSVPLP